MPGPPREAFMDDKISDELFDIKSDHCLIPLIPTNNSFNRNMVLTFGHSGVKFIIEKI